MNNQTGLLSKILHPPSEATKIGADLNRSYKKFSTEVSVLLTVLVLVPLTIVTLLSLYHYRQLLHDEEMDQLVLHLEQTAITLEKFIDELQAIILFVARDDQYSELSDPEKLKTLFTRLQKQYPGFTDIEVIGPQGKQKSYIGPYALTENNYNGQSWYEEVLRKGVYISNVFSGYRQVPHFVIAVSDKTSPEEGSWVLRVTVEAKTLQNFIDTINTTYADDAFLVDSDGFPQTEPMKFAKLGEQSTLEILMETTGKGIESERIIEWRTPENESSKLALAQTSINGQRVVQAVINLPDTPWRLVLIKEQYLHADAWNLFKVRLITILPFCIIITAYVISEISHALTDHLRDFDQKRKQFLAEAEHSNKLASIGRLAAGVAHEVNNPLAIINEKAGLVQDFIEMSEDLQFKEAMTGAIDGILNSVERCKKITHRLLGFARQTDVKTENVDLNHMIRDVVDFLAREATYNQIRIYFDLDNDLKKIKSDRGQLQQILLNITNNAIDAVGKNGQITLSSKQVDENTVQVDIMDDGPGMAAEIQQRIFDPFFTTKEIGKGTGLGLSIVYGLVKKLGGDISVVSQINKGTTFKITFPVNGGEPD